FSGAVKRHAKALGSKPNPRSGVTERILAGG
ncbi:MAG: hypothetical protein JWO81_866, partial [Alphaproteobacteria bacterium]|nr:hypothetical protein [Alphaproteobacteria bacterium]